MALGIQIARRLQDLIVESMKDVIPEKNIYLLSIPEKLDIINSAPLVKINTVISSPRGHSSNKTSFTKERFQVQFYFADYDETDYESEIVKMERKLEEYGYYFSTGYDSTDPDYNNLITITRQYNYRNNLY